MEPEFLLNVEKFAKKENLEKIKNDFNNNSLKKFGHVAGAENGDQNCDGQKNSIKIEFIENLKKRWFSTKKQKRKVSNQCMETQTGNLSLENLPFQLNQPSHFFVCHHGNQQSDHSHSYLNSFQNTLSRQQTSDFKGFIEHENKTTTHSSFSPLSNPSNCIYIPSLNTWSKNSRQFKSHCSSHHLNSHPSTFLSLQKYDSNIEKIDRIKFANENIQTLVSERNEKMKHESSQKGSDDSSSRNFDCRDFKSINNKKSKSENNRIKEKDIASGNNFKLNTKRNIENEKGEDFNDHRHKDLESSYLDDDHKALYDVRNKEEIIMRNAENDDDFCDEDLNASNDTKHQIKKKTEKNVNDNVPQQTAMKDEKTVDLLNVSNNIPLSPSVIFAHLPQSSSIPFARIFFPPTTLLSQEMRTSFFNDAFANNKSNDSNKRIHNKKTKFFSKRNNDNNTNNKRFYINHKNDNKNNVKNSFESSNDNFNDFLSIHHFNHHHLLCPNQSHNSKRQPPGCSNFTIDCEDKKNFSNQLQKKFHATGRPLIPTRSMLLWWVGVVVFVVAAVIGVFCGVAVQYLVTKKQQQNLLQQMKERNHPHNILQNPSFQKDFSGNFFYNTYYICLCKFLFVFIGISAYFLNSTKTFILIMLFLSS